MECGLSCIKYLLFIFNLVFAISGIGIITAGAVVLADVGEFSHFTEWESRMIAPSIVLIFAGTIIFVIAFLGCFGAIRKSYPMLMAFAVCLLIIFIIELAVGIAAAVYKNDFEDDALRDSLKHSMRNYTTDSSEKLAWDNLQRKLMCCGTEGSEDWRNSQVLIPNSCCKDTNVSSGSSCPGGYYNTGCLGKLKLKVQEKATVLIGIGIGIAFIQILGVVLACLLVATIKKQDGK